MADRNEKPIIKKIIKVEGGGHHGGAWKVAYADFVTAMMAFFMLLWLLNVAPPETLNGLADYFSPTTAATVGKSGSKSVNPPRSDAKGDNPNPAQIIRVDGPPPSGPDAGKKEGANQTSELAPEPFDITEDVIDAEPNTQLERLRDELQVQLQESEDLVDNQDQIHFEITEDGLKIHLLDKDRRAMFRSGSAELFGYAEEFIRNVAVTLSDTNNRIAILGHTDGGTYALANGYTKWDLSADRANAARRVLQAAGITEDRIAEVIGKSSTDPLYPDEPNRTENRRITLLLLREAPVVQPGSGIN